MAYKRGELKGVLPRRLGDMVTIDRKYDLAISNSCSYLNHIVVDTLQEGENCSHYLKMHSIVGPANFLFTKIFSTEPRNFKVPEGSQRLFDLI